MLCLARLTFILMLLPVSGFANDWDALDAPGAHAIMRHALAPGTGDPIQFDINDCSTQRNLDEKGQAQARNIGSILKARGISFDRILTSQWCRSRQTAELMDLGKVTDETALNSFFQDRSTAEQQTTATTDIAQNTKGPLLMVTHQVNITALTGVFPSSGEIVVFRLADDGVEVLGKIEIAP